MKRTILMIGGALALMAANLKAQTGPDPGEINPHTGYWIRRPETTLNWIGRSLDSIAQTQAAKEAREEAILNAAAAQAEAEAKALREAEAKQRFYQVCVEQDLRNQAKDEAYYRARGGRVLQGDPIPVKDDGRYDDMATVRLYLHDSGYDVSDAQVINVRSYMMAHGIRHVSELGQ